MERCPDRLCAVKRGALRKAVFLDRPNRILVICRLDGEPGETEAFLPNPGRLWEILLPGAVLYLSRDGASGSRRTEFTVVAAEREGQPVVLHTHFTNDAVEWLLRKKMVPGLEGYSIRKREAVSGRSRFDFLLENSAGRLFLEVKSCTLFSGHLAMFPDAPSLRGRKHVEELEKNSLNGGVSAVVVLVQSPRPRFFLPDFHTDPDFARAMLRARHHVQILPLAVGWDEDLCLSGEPRLLSIPWDILENEGGHGGNFLLISSCGEKKPGGVDTGNSSWGNGFWVSVGFVKTLSPSVRGTGRKGTGAEFPFAPETCTGTAELIPIRSSADRRANIEADLGEIAGWEKLHGGIRYFGFPSNPRRDPRFVRILLRYRMECLLQ